MNYSEEERRQLAAMRIAKADSALADALTLADHGSCCGTVNRCYYAMFHAASALAIWNDCDFHKHHAIISWFQREYVKTGRISREIGGVLQEAFEARCNADYVDVTTFTAAEVSALLDHARRFVAEVKALLEKV